MTVLLRDAKREAARNLGAMQQVHERARADDALLAATTGDVAAEYMRCVQGAGQQYGRQFNLRKLEVSSAGCDACILKPDGGAISQKGAQLTLGA